MAGKTIPQPSDAFTVSVLLRVPIFWRYAAVITDHTYKKKAEPFADPAFDEH
jgi:hypothetical protein